ncbi:MAG TPA: hypothetical protein PLX89_03160 [Verrucomicrobiota bacterium]|nr:hypothetical protein [Verrucomicrobiales bacterium]HRI11981.1 hypothetical protein [Verrucomicrobiota bacterium]
MKSIILSFALVAVLVAGLAQQPTPAERVTALKADLAASQAALKQYQWIQTTTVTLNGEEKSRKQERCYYGLDGALTKVALTPEAPPAEPRGLLRRRIAERKQEELTGFMKEAVALVHKYMPPNPALIQAAKEAGRVTVQPIDPGKRARLTFTDYLKKGDSLSLEVDLNNNHPLAANVNSYLDSDKDPITLAVTFGALANGTTYPSQYVLDSKSKNLKVTVDNSGYQKNQP